MRQFAPVALICALACALCISTYSVFGHTWDEPEHLAAGIALLDTGDYPYDQQHPPLARIAMALGPFLAGAHSHGNAGPSGEQEGRDILYGEGHYDRYLMLARLGMLPFLIMLLIATWMWARSLYGQGPALLATALVATTPVIIGHAAIAALDIPMVGSTMLALYLLWNWYARPSTARALGFGFVAGIAAGTKLSSIPFIGCVVAAWTIAWVAESIARKRKSLESRPPPQLSTLSIHVLLALSVACIVLFACYGFTLDHVIASFKMLLEHNRFGHLSYFMGELRRNGWWDFYLVALGLKTPLPLLLTGVLGSVWLAHRAIREQNWRSAAPAFAWFAVLLFASAYSHINIGVRHVLIILPLLAMAAAALVAELWRRSRSTAMRVVVSTVLAWQAWSFASAHPDYLPYFNELAGAHPEKILIDSDLDWGQDLRRLKLVLRDRNIAHFSFVYRGTADLQREGFPSFEFLWPHRPATGWIAVSLLAKATGSEDGGYDWLNAYRPVMRVGKSIDLYYIETRDK
jgi:hypothetical protein